MADSASSASPGDNHSTSTKRSAPSKGKDLAGSKRTRQRQALSCQECRRLKLKCDRTFPCAACRRRGCAKICPDGVSKPPGRAVQIQAEFHLLLKRIDALEGIIRDLGQDERIPPPLPLVFATKRATSFSKEVEAKIEDASTADDRFTIDDEDDGPSDPENAGNGAGEGDETGGEESLIVGIGSLQIAGEESGRYLGASAGSAYFFDDDNDDEPASVEPASATSDITRYPYIQLGPTYAKAAEVERLRSFLPPIDDAKRLAENYYNYLAFQFVPLGAQDFWSDYWPAAFTPDDSHATKLAAVFMILSLGSLFDPEAPSTPNAKAHELFVLAHNTLAAARFLSNNTLAASQTIQLSASFLLCQHDLREGGETFFPLLGIGLRMLVTQALHRDGTLFSLQGDELNRRRRIFYELITIERMQAFISGRPYMIQNSQFDTKMPENASSFDVCKWKLGIFIGKVIDKAFSVAAPSYSTILGLDEDLRSLVRESPAELRSGALPPDAFLVKPQSVPQLPPGGAPKTEDGLIFRMQQHTMDQMYGQVLFYLHKPAFAQALLRHSEEPLRSPYSASVAAVSLETAVYLLAVAKSWIQVHPVLCPRWWHIFFHAFAASVAQSSLVIKCPSSMLAPHAWSQINEAVVIFETAGAGGAPCASFVPRLKSLREKAWLSLQNLISVPLGLGRGDMSESLLEGTDVNKSILNPPARLERLQEKKRAQHNPRTHDQQGPTSENSSPSPNSALAHALGTAPARSAQAAPVFTHPSMSSDKPFTAFDPTMYRHPASSPSPPGTTSTTGSSSSNPSTLSTFVMPSSSSSYGHQRGSLSRPNPPQSHPPHPQATPHTQSSPSPYVRSWPTPVVPSPLPPNHISPEVLNPAQYMSHAPHYGFAEFATDFPSIEPASIGFDPSSGQPPQAWSGESSDATPNWWYESFAATNHQL
ncbi:hypothetical protein JCM10212_000670 [Sporobolomyces blumeae]